MCDEQNDNNLKNVMSHFIYTPCDQLSKKYDSPIKQIMQEILRVPLDYILSIIDEGEIEYCYPRHIPQYSNLSAAIEVEVNYLAENGKTSLEKIGSILPRQTTNSIGAKIKYGENHSKLLEIFGLTLVTGGHVELTEMGICFSELDTEQRLEYIKRSIFRAPIIRNIILKSKHQAVSVREELSLFLSESTANRRLPNVLNLIKLLEDTDQIELTKRLDNIRR